LETYAATNWRNRIVVITVRFSNRLESSYSRHYQQHVTLTQSLSPTVNMSQRSASVVFCIRRSHLSVKWSVEFWTWRWHSVICGSVMVMLVVVQGTQCLVFWCVLIVCLVLFRFRPPSATDVSAEPFSHRTGTLRCLQKEMATYRHWSVSLWRDPDDVSHCRILSPDKTEWRLISAKLCGWGRCFVADQLWLMTRIREEEEDCSLSYSFTVA